MAHTLINLRDTSPGDEIIVGNHKRCYVSLDNTDIESEVFATVITHRTINGVCIGFKNEDGRCSPYHDMPGWRFIDRYYEFRDINIYGCLYGWWLSSNTKVCLANAIVITPNQVCIDCGLDASHAKPNWEDTKFICSVCAMMRKL